jgi:photosystem II stability/assembly factor-like uncharacterized protein
VGVDPDNGAVIYTLFGGGQGSKMGIYKSSDYGDSWTFLLPVFSDANRGPERKWSNNVVVDPNNHEIVYFGTRDDGLLRTLDGGKNFDFQPHPDVPTNPDEALKTDDGKQNLIIGHVGIRNVVIDPSEKMENPVRSKTIYLSAFTKGIYRSTDGGMTFQLTEGNPKNVSLMKLSPKGVLYAIGQFDEGLWLFDGQWHLLKPGAFQALAIDPHDPEGKRILIATGGNPATIFRTTDAGATWETLEKDAAWTPKFPENWNVRKPGQGTATLDFDLSTPSRLYQCDAFGAWVTEAPYATPIIWSPLHEGLEGTVSFALSSPPDNGNVYPLYSGGSDANNYAHVDPTKIYPSEKLAPARPPNEGTQWLAYSSDIDFCMSNPDVMYRAVEAHNKRQYIMRTDNGGKTAADWTVVATSHDESPLQKILNWSGGVKKIAVSATDPDACLVAGWGSQGNYYTHDGGKTWTKVTGVLKDDRGFIPQRGWAMYGHDKTICADRVNGNIFYAYDDKKFYRNEEKAANGSWVNTFTFPEERNPNDWKLSAFHLQAAPANEGHLALNFGKNVLWITKDGGDHWTRLEGVEDCRSSGWGKSAPDQQNSTLYAHAKINGQWGIYSSFDFGTTWNKLTPDNITFNIAANMTGDLRTFGTVYFSESGRGIVFGRLKVKEEAGK